MSEDATPVGSVWAHMGDTRGERYTVAVDPEDNQLSLVNQYHEWYYLGFIERGGLMRVDNQ